MDLLSPDIFSTLWMKGKFCIVSNCIRKFQVGHWFEMNFCLKSCLCFCRDSRDRSIKINDHFTYISASVANWITRSCCKKLYIGETGRRLDDRFRGRLHDVERSEKDASKPVARHLYLASHSEEHMAVCGLSLHLGSSENRKTREHGINVRFSFN